MGNLTRATCCHMSNSQKIFELQGLHQVFFHAFCEVFKKNNLQLAKLQRCMVTSVPFIYHPNTQRVLVHCSPKRSQKAASQSDWELHTQNRGNRKLWEEKLKLNNCCVLDFVVHSSHETIYVFCSLFCLGTIFCICPRQMLRATCLLPSFFGEYTPTYSSKQGSPLNKPWYSSNHPLMQIRNSWKQITKFCLFMVKKTNLCYCLMAQLWCSRAGEPQQQCQQDQPTNVRDLPQFLQVLEGVWLTNFLRKPTVYNCNPWFQICQTLLQKPGSVQEQKLFIKTREISNVQLIGTDSSLALLSIGLRSCSKCHDIFPKLSKSQRKTVTKKFYFTQTPRKKSLFLQPYCHSKGPIIKNCVFFLAFLVHLQKNTKKSTCKKKNHRKSPPPAVEPPPHQPMHAHHRGGDVMGTPSA